jgi:outer membrane protein
MKVILSFSALLTLALLTSETAAGGEWTLRRCEEAAVAHSYLLERSAIGIDQASAEYRESAAVRSGSVNTGFNYGYISETMQMTLTSSTPSGPVSRTMNFGDGNSYDASISAQLPLYTGGALRYRSEAAKLGVEAARLSLALDTVQVLYQVRNAYWLASGARTRLDVAGSAVTRLERHVKDLTTALSLGAATEEMIRLVESRLASARASMATARGDYQMALTALGSLVGDAVSELPPIDAGNSNLHQPLSEGIDPTRPEKVLIGIRLKQAEVYTKVVKAAYLPGLYGSTALHYARPGVDAIANDWTGYFTAGLSLSWNAWDWGARDARTDKARALERILKVQNREIEENLSTAISISIEKVSTSQRALQFTIQKQQAEAARVELIRQRLAHGAATRIELLDAEDDLDIADLEIAGAVIKCRLAETELLRANADRRIK